ncbi:hypothetical protein GYH30_050071 [Glycine max]|nr:hypothetical protein GYH30_050071 [Glycine max]
MRRQSPTLHDGFLIAKTTGFKSVSASLQPPLHAGNIITAPPTPSSPMTASPLSSPRPTTAMAVIWCTTYLGFRGAMTTAFDVPWIWVLVVQQLWHLVCHKSEFCYGVWCNTILDFGGATIQWQQ